MQNIPLNVPLFWRAGIPENVYCLGLGIVEIFTFSRQIYANEVYFKQVNVSCQYICYSETWNFLTTDIKVQTDSPHLMNQN